MLCTEDFEIVELKGNEYFGQVVVCTRVPHKGVRKYIRNCDEIGVSTRSKLARRFSIFEMWEERPKLKRENLNARLVYRNLTVPVIYEVGQRVGRFYAFRCDERIRESELEDVIKQCEIPGRVICDQEESLVAIAIGDEYLETVRSEDPVSMEVLVDDPSKYINEKGSRKWNKFQDNTLLLTERVRLPDHVYGLITGTTWMGGTYTLSSSVVDPGWNGRLLVEIRTKEDPVVGIEKPELLMQLYRATPIENL